MYKFFVAATCCFLVLLLDNIVPVESGECCRDHFNRKGTYHGQTWCPTYCCGFASEGLFCCSNPLLRTFDGNRDIFCSSWFWYTQNLWAPILIGLVILAIIIGCCVGCIRCCCFI